MLLATILFYLFQREGRGGSPLWTPGIRVVLNIFSYWAEHKGRIPISKVCRRSWARDLPPRTTASVPSPRGQPSYWQDLLAVQAVAVQKEGVDGVARARRLHGSGRDIQEVLRARPGTMPAVRFVQDGGTDLEHTS